MMMPAAGAPRAGGALKVVLPSPLAGNRRSGNGALRRYFPADLNLFSTSGGASTCGTWH
jgi:hypothetical protein